MFDKQNSKCLSSSACTFGRGFMYGFLLYYHCISWKSIIDFSKLESYHARELKPVSESSQNSQSAKLIGLEIFQSFPLEKKLQLLELIFQDKILFDVMMGYYLPQ